MEKYILGTRGHDYGKGTVAEICSHIKEDGWSCVQLAFKKMVSGVKDYEDITPELVAETKNVMQAASLEIAVLGTYVELGSLDDAKRQAAVRDFISQTPVCKRMNAACMGSETTSLKGGTAIHKDAKRALLKSLESIMPIAEEQGVIVALEPVYTHTMNSVETTKEILESVKSANLKIIFDMANLMGPEWIDKQDILFGRAIENWGEHIAAVHIKGVCYDNGVRKACTLENSIVDYRSAFVAMKGLPQTIIPVLREETIPVNAKRDQEFIKKIMDM